MFNRKSISSKLLALALGFAIIEIADAATPETKDTKPQTNQEKKIQEKKQEKKQERKLAKTSANPLAAKPLLTSKVLSAMIDAEISKKIKEEKVTPSAKSTDAEFQRRAYLDIIGRIPTSVETRAFLENTIPSKRVKLVDDLLADDEFGKHMADIWQALLLPRLSDNRRVQTEPMTLWLEKHFNGNTGWDQITKELLTSTGPQDQNGSITYFISNASVDKITDSVSKLFLGVQLQCAQCHNHPFVDWKQNDYWGLAAFFMKVQAKPPGGKDTSSPTVSEGKAIVKNKKTLPEAAKFVPAKFLASGEATLNSAEPYRPVLANWLTSKTNPFFSKAMVNRVWAQYFGKGLVDPVDDMHDGNPATHPELLETLATQFSASNFDLKFLIRSICNSETYQRTSKPNASNKETDIALLARMPIKNMTPEQLFDSLATVLGAAGKADQKLDKVKAGKNLPKGARAQFVTFFQPEEGTSALSYETGIPQILRLMNSPQMNSAVIIQKLVDKNADTKTSIEKVYLSVLNRLPTDEEFSRMTNFLSQATDKNKGLSDMLWVLLNTSEFTLNH
ncbi:MAG: DUF1553 domain-containing protein [Gemmataceae bacterium]|nr:DUF1553 domain-containing protein [Gemmataceae bacterium]